MDKKSWRFTHFCKSYYQRKIGTFLWALRIVFTSIHFFYQRFKNCINNKPVLEFLFNKVAGDFSTGVLSNLWYWLNSNILVSLFWHIFYVIQVYFFVLNVKDNSSNTNRQKSIAKNLLLYNTILLCLELFLMFSLFFHALSYVLKRG